jgi:hypothetical protein
MEKWKKQMQAKSTRGKQEHQINHQSAASKRPPGKNHPDPFIKNPYREVHSIRLMLK